MLDRRAGAAVMCDNVRRDGIDHLRETERWRIVHYLTTRSGHQHLVFDLQRLSFPAFPPGRWMERKGGYIVIELNHKEKQTHVSIPRTSTHP